MPRTNRRASDKTWVQQLRSGEAPRQIAADSCDAESTVRYHLGIAVRNEPEMQDEHDAVRKAHAGITAQGTLSPVHPEDFESILGWDKDLLTLLLGNAGHLKQLLCPD